MLWLERTDHARAPLEGSAAAAALDAALAPPHPWVIVSDEWGSLLRLEASTAGARLELREVTSEGVRWSGLGPTESPGTQVTLHLPGRTVKVAPTEVLDAVTARAAVERFVAHGATGLEMARRPLQGDHGRLYLMAVGQDEPRPSMGWGEIAARLGAQDASGPLVAALSEPGRVLIGVFGQCDDVTVTVQETRSAQAWSRRIEQLEGSGAPKEVALPTGTLTVPARQVLTRADAMTVLESLYRFDVPPPGFGWTLG